MLTSQPITVDEIVVALKALGGEAQAKDIKDQVVANRGGIPSQYRSTHSCRETIQAIIERYCPQSWNFPGNQKTAYFERVRRGRYRLIVATSQPIGGDRRIAEMAVDIRESIEAEQIGYQEQRPCPEPPTAADMEAPEPSRRVEATIHRIVRDTALARRLKQLHANRCQICGESIGLHDGGTYSESHHIRPLGSPHDGPDIAENIVILCPNHHAQCDLGAIVLELEKLEVVPGHNIGSEFVDYHNENIFKGQSV